MKELSIGSLILTVWRTIADLSQKEADARTGFSDGSTSYYERKKEPPPEILDTYRGVYNYPEYMLRRTRDFVEEALAARGALPAPDPEEVYRRELEEMELAVFRELSGRLDALAEAYHEHRGAPYLWRQLAHHSAQERLAMVKVGKEFWSPGLCVLLCEKSVEAAANDGREAEALARLAIEVARRVRGGKARRARLEGFAQAFVANAFRVRGQLPAADEAFALALVLWERGAGAFHELLDPSRILDLLASLRREQRRLPESIALLQRALPLARTSKAKGRILLLLAKALEEKGAFAEAISVLDKAEPHVRQAGDPHHIFALTFNRLGNLCDLKRAGEARLGLKEVSDLAASLRSDLHGIRCRWLAARVYAGLGHREDAMVAFREVHRALAARLISYDCALVLLELSVLLLEERQTGEVRELASHLEPIFLSQGVHREALAALRLFADAARKEQATLELARCVLDFLRRSRCNSEVHCCALETPSPDGRMPGEGASSW